MVFVIILASALFITAAYLAYKNFILTKKLKPILVQEEHLAALEKHAKEIEKGIEGKKVLLSDLTQLDDLYKAIAAAQASQKTATSELDKTQTQLNKAKKELTDALEVNEMAQSGIIKLQYNFGTSKEYEEKLDTLRERQKDLVRDKKAIVCNKEWTVGGSKAEGKKMIDRLIKLGLNAFNYQSDNIILNVKYSNFDRSKEKIEKLRDTVTKLLEVNECFVSSEYFKLKLQELELVYGYQEKLFEEKEEQKRIRLQMQEEEKVRREIERVKVEAEKEELFFEKALEKAKREIEKKSGDEREAYIAKIREMEAQLAEAHAKKERAISQAEQTKRGHVYVISNIGSFGENVLKIGMTRRLDPMDRIWELGDASVPFEFDVHAMIFSEDAPNLEKSLHAHFTQKRTNQINLRKEFFNITIMDIESACLELKIPLKLTLLAEAKEYRQSVQRVNELKKSA